MLVKNTEPEILKDILEEIRHPERLDDHPWAGRGFVRDAVRRDPLLGGESPGRQLVAALADLFPKIKPGMPPRRGKRLDTHWGEFGLLAALYFAPQRLGLPAPGSLREAWGHIDESILLYAYGRDGNHVSKQEIETYRLVGGEPEAAATSTLSDWHRNGIRKLADAISLHEEHLEKFSARGPLALPARVEVERTAQASRLTFLRKSILPLFFCLLIALTLGGYKARRVYLVALPLREDLAALQQFRSAELDGSAVLKLGPLLSQSRRDFEALSKEVDPVLWLGDWLGWVPVYGEDLRASRDLLRMGDLLLQSGEETYAALQPLMTALQNQSHLDPARMVTLLNAAQPELLQARARVQQAQRIRSELRVDGFSPRTRTLIEGMLDPALPLMQDGLTVATALPRILGAASDGPKTYLLLAQNEDELRPTGGFITAVGTLVVQNGSVVRVNFVDSGEVDNWNLPYPQAPWQLEQYMNSPVLILRDANWFPDFPMSALYAETLYAYSNYHSVDGVIAFDQHLLVTLLQALGPIQVMGATEPIDAENVISYMRLSKSAPVDGPVPAGWSRKGFMDKIAQALLEKIFDGKDLSWEKIGHVLLEDLNEGHLLLQMDDPNLTDVLDHRGWDGALRYEGGDYLMAVDSNIGFNKTNAVVNTALTYDVDLNDITDPTGTLTVAHQNRASAEIPCLQWGSDRPAGEEDYPIDACYWNYMRVYVPAGTKLLDGTPQNVPAQWMILEQAVDAPVDQLDEDVEGLQAFGTLMVVPGGKSQQDIFRFQLPASVLRSEGNQRVYSLDFEKQPGTLATPLTIRIHLPARAVLISSSMNATTAGHDLLIETDLRTDVHLQVIFSLP